MQMNVAMPEGGQLLAGGLRASTLIARLGLMLYLAANLTLEEVGLFSLYWATIHLASGLIPLDVYAHTSRLLLTEGADRVDILSKHAGFILVVGIVCSPAVAFVSRYFGLEISQWLFVILIFHIALEVFSTEFGRLLVPLGKPLEANFILFLRSALWVVPLIALFASGFLDASLPFVVGCWFVGTVSSLILGLVIFRNAFTERIRLKLDSGWVVAAVGGSFVFLLATLLFRAMLGADRHVVSFFFDIEVVAVYGLFASVALGVLALVESGVSSWHYPKLLMHIRSGDFDAAKRSFRKYFMQNLLASSILVAAVGAIFPVFVLLFLDAYYFENLSVLFFIIAGVFIYCLSMPFHYVIYSFGVDYILVLIYSFALAIMLGWACLFMVGIGSVGAGIMLFIALASIGGFRFVGALRAWSMRGGVSAHRM